MKLKFDVTTQEYGIVNAILTQYLPANCKVWVFGSRAKNQAKYNSDLDLALEGKDTIAPLTMQQLKQAFVESKLPYTVDVLDINNISESFKAIARGQAVVFPLRYDKTPVLRFAEFEGEWEEKLILDIAPLQRGFDLPNPQIKEGLYPVVFSNGILKHHSDFRACGPGVVTGRSGTIGKVTYIEDNYWPHNTSLWVTDFKNNFPKFIYYFYLTIDLQGYAAGSSVPTLNRNNIHAIKSAIPTLPEQQKIAAFLGAVDEKLTLLRRKHEALKAHKKGLMQQIFAQKLRFKQDNGTDFSDWEEKMLGEVSSKTASAITAQSLEDNPGSYTVYGASGELTKIDSFLSSVEHIGIVKDGAGVGRVMLCSPNSSVLGTLDSIIAKAQNDTKFIYYWLSNFDFRPYITGSTIPHIYYRDYSKLDLFIPHPYEQRKIASFLSTIDTKIDTVSSQIARMEAFKQGLLQQMFV